MKFITFIEQPCKLRNGGCPEYMQHRVKGMSDKGNGYTIRMCHLTCKLHPTCKIFVYRKDQGSCHLYKDTALLGCSVTVDETKMLEMFSTENCGSGISFSFAQHRNDKSCFKLEFKYKTIR